MGFFGSPIEALVAVWANSRRLSIRFLFCCSHSCSGDPPSESVLEARIFPDSLGEQPEVGSAHIELSRSWSEAPLPSLFCFDFFVFFSRLTHPFLFSWSSSQLCTSLGSAVAKLSLQVSSCQPYPIS